jgi:hypothetical protein
MIYLADTANCEEIRDLINYYPIVGVTTNPSLLAHEGKPLSKIIPQILECVFNGADISYLSFHSVIFSIPIIILSCIRRNQKK